MALTEAAIAPALAEARAIVRLDGSDFDLLSIDDDTVRLRLRLDGASCPECVLPRGYLESLVLDMMRRRSTDVTAVVIDDPRESPDWTPQQS
jgi:Fe-S cluster biogenesis protein NfuA